MDPLLMEQDQGSNIPPRKVAHPRGQTKGWDEVGLTVDRVSVPANAYRLGDGFSILNNQLIDSKGEPTSLKEAYTPESPLRNLFDSTNAKDYTNDGLRNYSYMALKDNPEWQTAIQELSLETGIPGKWIADVMAVLTHGTFANMGNVSPVDVYKNNVPLTGPHTSPKGQVDILKAALSRHKLSELLDGPEWVIAGAMLDETAFSELKADPKLAKQKGNGVRTMKEVWDLLGSHVGGAYDHALNAERKAKWSHVHTDFMETCAVCHALRHSNSEIIPHQYQEAVEL